MESAADQAWNVNHSSLSKNCLERGFCELCHLWLSLLSSALSFFVLLCRLNRERMTELQQQVEDLQKALQSQAAKPDDVSATGAPVAPVNSSSLTFNLCYGFSYVTKHSKLFFLIKPLGILVNKIVNKN